MAGERLTRHGRVAVDHDLGEIVDPAFLPKPAEEPSDPNESGPGRLTVGLWVSMVPVMAQHLDNAALTPWDRDFVTSLNGRLRPGMRLTEKQIANLTRINATLGLPFERAAPRKREQASFVIEEIVELPRATDILRGIAHPVETAEKLACSATAYAVATSLVHALYEFSHRDLRAVEWRDMRRRAREFLDALPFVTASRMARRALEKWGVRID